MTDETKMRGFPSVNQPWSKYYSKETPELPSSEMSMYAFCLRTIKTISTTLELTILAGKFHTARWKKWRKRICNYSFSVIF